MFLLHVLRIFRYYKILNVHKTRNMFVNHYAQTTSICLSTENAKVEKRHNSNKVNPLFSKVGPVLLMIPNKLTKFQGPGSNRLFLDNLSHKISPHSLTMHDSEKGHNSRKTSQSAKYKLKYGSIYFPSLFHV